MKMIMKRSLWISVTVIGILLGGAMGVVRLYGQTRNAPTTNYAQSPKGQPGQPQVYNAFPGQPAFPTSMPVPGAFTTHPSPTGPAYPPGIMANQVPTLDAESRAAVNTLQSPDSNQDDKEKAKETLRKHLKEVFDKDQDRRRSQIANLEKQIDRLKKQLEKRDESQSKLIDLRIQLLENEGAGLGFPDSWQDLHPTGPSQPAMTPGFGMGVRPTPYSFPNAAQSPAIIPNPYAPGPKAFLGNGWSSTGPQPGYQPSPATSNYYQPESPYPSPRTEDMKRPERRRPDNDVDVPIPNSQPRKPQRSSPDRPNPDTPHEDDNPNEFETDR
jgi:hypothetical protein